MVFKHYYMGVSKNRGTPPSSILIGFSIINHPFWGTSIFGNTHIAPLPQVVRLLLEGCWILETSFVGFTMFQDMNHP